MSATDVLAPLPGEPRIPPLVPRAPGSSVKTLAAAGLLLLSLVAVLGFVASRYLASKKEPVTEPAGDAAAAGAPRLTFKDPMTEVAVAGPTPGKATSPDTDPAVQAIALARQPRVPSIEPDGAGQARAIPVRGTPTVATRPQVAAGDESPFTTGGPDGSAERAMSSLEAGLGRTPAGPQVPTTDAQASLRRYQTQLGSMLGQLQSLTDRASGGGSERVPSASAALTAALTMPTVAGGTASTTPSLFGSMERSSTPMVSAALMGNRSLTMPKGVLFTCALKTRVVTAASGFVACQLQRNVFSDDGKVVLAERGSHLDGEYRVVQVRPGVTRIPVLWTRLRTPLGVTVELDSPGTGPLGESGIGGYVDNRWPERIGAALLVSMIDDAVKIVASDSTDNAGSTTVLLPSTTAAGSKLAERVLEATINIPPLLYQNQGSVVGVYVARDVDFSKVYALEPR